MAPPMSRGERPQAGFSYVWVLCALALAAAALAQVGPWWSMAQQREREAELIRIGTAYAEAIARYEQLSPGSLKKYPSSLDALLLDTRFIGTSRHLRKAYTDPMNPGQPFGIVRGDDGTIRGVFSTSSAQPLRREPLDLGMLVLPAASRYSDWRFIPLRRP